MATHHGYPDPSHGQSPASFHPFLQESRSAWPAMMDFERTHQNVHAFENHSTNLRDLSLQRTFESPRMTTGPEIMIDGIIPRASPLIERDVSALSFVNREPAIHYHDHTLPRAPRRSPPTWGPSRYRQQQSQRCRRFNHLSPSLRIPEPSYDPRREGPNRDLAHNSRRRSPDLRYPPSRNRPSPPLSSRWPSNVHELWNSTSFPNTRRYSPYPPPGNRRRRSPSDRRRRALSPSQHHYRPEWEREQSSYQHRRQEPRERNANATPAVNA